MHRFEFRNTPYMTKWMNPDRRLFVAEKDGEPIGFSACCSDGENYLTEHILNICGLYVVPEYRKLRLADALMEPIFIAAEKEGIPSVGVDCETMNPTALRYWQKQFSPYTYSYFRRLDERAVEAFEHEAEWYY